ncbi:hypothetical protein BPY_23420 [Bifidobacterium psychraerophilum]|uniref:hypothetical protein n=1 Tax=Bifidobacterium psychraerophilum TaxID=218140 RepID=UPI0031159AC4
MKQHKALLALAVSVGLLAVPVTAQASESNVQVKYDTTFTYLGGNRWTVSPNSAQFALHNIGARQSWLCNANNVGAGITACVPGTTYETTGEAYADGLGSCVYVQGDAPAWDTVPGDPSKRVCADEPAPEPEPVVPVAPVDPTPEPSTDPTPAPTEPTEPTEPTPVDPSTPVEPDPEPSESVDPTPDPAEPSSDPEPTGTATATPATTTRQTSKQADTKTTNAPAEFLATTGSDPKPIALAATVLLVIGASLVGCAGRRRR